MCAAITTAAIGVASAGYQIYQSQKAKKEAKEALNDYERETLDNAYEDVSISTVGSDLIKEEAARTTGSLVDSAKSGGTRSVMGSIPKIQAYNDIQMEKARENLDRQMINRDYAIAGDNSNIRGMQERREIEDLAGLGQMYNTARQDTWSGIRGVGNSLIYGANNIDFSGNNPQVSSPNSGIESQGVTPFTTGGL